MTPIVNRWTPHARHYELGRGRFSITSSISRLNYADEEGVFRHEINTQVGADGVNPSNLHPGFEYGYLKLPYRLEGKAEGSRRIWPDRNRLDEWFDIRPVGQLGNQGYLLGNKMGPTVFRSNDVLGSYLEHEVNNSKSRLDLFLTSVPSFNRLEFEITENNITIDQFIAPLICYQKINNVPKFDWPRGAIGWSKKNGLIEIEFDLTGMPNPSEEAPIVIDPTIDVSVGAADSDGYRDPDGWVNHFSGDIAIGRWVSQDFLYSLHFTGLSGLGGATIDTCTVDLYKSGNAASASQTWKWYLEKAAAPDAITTNSEFDSATRTTASVNQTMAANVANGWKTSPELKTLLQEIVDVPLTPTSLVVLTEKVSFAADCYILWEAYEDAGTNQATLHIEYSTSANAGPLAGGIPLKSKLKGLVG